MRRRVQLLLRVGVELGSAVLAIFFWFVHVGLVYLASFGNFSGARLGAFRFAFCGLRCLAQFTGSGIARLRKGSGWVLVVGC
jgi:hypothetical protein